MKSGAVFSPCRIWGVHGALHGRGAEILRRLGPLHCLGVTKAGHPKHPLYLSAATKLQDVAA